MGRVTTPTYRVEMRVIGAVTTPASWDRHHGRPTPANLERYAHEYACSVETGGVNEHVSRSLGVIPYPLSARIVRQKDKAVIAEWQAGAFQVWPCKAGKPDPTFRVARRR